jgi:surface polysaccharide O-acyltransferase-like enzyme
MRRPVVAAMTASPPSGLTAHETSRAISFARIVLVIGLVFLHYQSFPNSRVSPFNGFDPGAHAFATWLNSTVLFFFFSAVPLLSMISGWLFFSPFKGDAGPALWARIRSRFVSLYLPLVCWNALVLVAVYALFSVSPGHALLQSLNIDLQSAGLREHLNAVFAFTQRPIAFQFWFVRDLFLTVLLSPLLWLLLRHAPWVGAVALGLAWLANANLGIFFRPDVPCFFYLGALLQRRQLRLTIPWRITLLLLALYAVLVGLRALAPALGGPGNGDVPFVGVATRLMRIVGVLGCWGLIYRAAQTRAGGAVGAYAGLAYFLYAAHWPLLALVKLWLWPLVPAQTDAWMLAHYVASVGATVLIGLGFGLLLSRRFPQGFALMNGGRTFGEAREHSPAPPPRAAPWGTDSRSR